MNELEALGDSRHPPGQLKTPKAIVVIIYGVERKVLTIIAPIPQW